MFSYIFIGIFGGPNEYENAFLVGFLEHEEEIRGGFWGLDSKFLKVFDLKKQIVYLSPKPVIARERNDRSNLTPQLRGHSSEDEESLLRLPRPDNRDSQ